MLLRQVQARPVQGDHLRALRRRGHPLEGPPRADGPHRARRPRHPHLVPRGTRAGWPTSSGHRGPRGAEGQAAREGHLLRRQPGHLGRRRAAPRGPGQRSRPSSEEIADIERQRDLELDRRFKELEEELAKLEEGGAKDAESRPASGLARRRSAPVRERAEADIDLAKRAFDDFRDLHPRKIIEDELLWRELTTATGTTSRAAWAPRPSPSSSTGSTSTRRRSSSARPSTPPTVAGPCRPSAGRRPSSGSRSSRRSTAATTTAAASTTRGP